MNDKAELRDRMRKARRCLDASAQSQAAHGLLTQLNQLPSLIQSDHIAMYIANDGEIDPVEFMGWCWNSGRKTYVPVISSESRKKSLLFAEVDQNTEHHFNRFGISEPVVANHKLVSPRELDLVLLPLVAFDNNGNRVGMGGGFYDTTFEFLGSEHLDKPKLVGVAHDIQRVEEITAESWDIPLSIVVTDSGIYNLSTDGL